MTLILDREGEREHPAVAVPQQVDPPESQGLPDALDFLDGSLDREERGPSRPFALADPELIVEDDPIAEGGEVRETREVSVRHPRAPVEAEDRAAIRRAERFPGQTVAEDGDLPLRRRHRVSHGLGDAHRFVGTILFHANKDDSLDRESKDRADATERLELLAGLVVTTHEDDGPTGRLGRAHELLDPGVAHDGIAHEEGLDRAGIGRLLHLRRTVGHRAVCGDRLEEFFDELRLVSDAAFAEHLGADARPEASWIPCIPACAVPWTWTFAAKGGSRAFRYSTKASRVKPGPTRTSASPTSVARTWARMSSKNTVRASPEGNILPCPGARIVDSSRTPYCRSWAISASSSSRARNATRGFCAAATASSIRRSSWVLHVLMIERTSSTPTFRV